MTRTPMYRCDFPQSGQRSTIHAFIAVAFALVQGCDSGTSADEDVTAMPFGSDEKVFAFITQTDPYAAFALFPHADSVVAGSLNGSTAHRPMVRVSMNALAGASLESGRFPAGGAFRDSSVVLKQIRDGSGTTTLIAVIVKQKDHPLAGNGWLWAEYQLDGTPAYSVKNKGAACTGCHSLDQGPQHDFVRTFERQTP